jgi:hypothetical protein
MFQDAIVKWGSYIAPIYTGINFYGSDEVSQSVATMIVINDEGWFLTCKHVCNNLVIESTINDNYLSFQNELKEKKENMKTIERIFNFKKDTVVLLKTTL